MANITLYCPNTSYSGTLYGVVFTGGTGTIDEDSDYLGWFESRGFGIDEPADPILVEIYDYNTIRFPVAQQSTNITNGSQATGTGAVKASGTSGVEEDNNAIDWTAADFGDYGNGITINIEYSEVVGAATAVTVAGNAITLTVGNSGAYAAVTLNSQGAGKVVLTKDDPGVFAGAVEVEIAEGNNASLATDYTNDVLTVTLGTDAQGAVDNAKNTNVLVAQAINTLDCGITAEDSGTGSLTLAESLHFGGGAAVTQTLTASQAITAISNNAAASSLVSGANQGESTGNGVVDEEEVVFTGGTDALVVTGAEYNALVGKVNGVLAALRKAGILSTT